ncbi:cytochrome c [Novosphingobium sp. YJ-S2-02]|uniref:Cytochrome c n=1 Tax=Novosphingobium aureum TaxID=2792964 RepID=A0A931HEJ8_9SPHN|nr:cytochrome c [Novosphingobium aureum]MBH0114556.1 cytochrome c [Novosphingobium aureum]
MIQRRLFPTRPTANRPGFALVALAIAAALVPPAPALASGTQVYSSRCSMCHQSEGAGLPGQFPRLKGRAAQIAGSKEGRTYLVQVMLHGIFGSIKVDGRPINGMMPAMGTLKDADIADTLNYLVALDPSGGKKVAAFTAGEVKAVRDAGKMSSGQVAKLRAGLAAKGLIP